MINYLHLNDRELIYRISERTINRYHSIVQAASLWNSGMQLNVLQTLGHEKFKRSPLRTGRVFWTAGKISVVSSIGKWIPSNSWNISFFRHHENESDQQKHLSWKTSGIIVKSKHIVVIMSCLIDSRILLSLFMMWSIMMETMSLRAPWC